MWPFQRKPKVLDESGFRIDAPSVCDVILLDPNKAPWARFCGELAIGFSSPSPFGYPRVNWCQMHAPTGRES